MIRRTGLVLASVLMAMLAMAPSPATPASAAASLTAPVRVLDTRSGLGVGGGRVGVDQVRLEIPGVSIVGQTAVMLNLAAADASREGFVSAWPCDASRPETAVLNFAPGRAVSNMVVLRYPAAGLCFGASSPVHLVADLTGVTTNGEINGIAPARLVDTRDTQQYRANREYRVRVGGRAGIPANAGGAAINVTVVRPSATGRVVVTPCDSTSDAATLNYQPGEVVPHLTFAKLTGGELCITSNQNVDVVVDAFAWMGDTSKVRMITPDRLLDTRTGQGGTFGSVRDGQTIRLRVAGESGVPNDADGVTVNIAVTDVGHRGYVTAWPCDVTRPVAASLNMWPGMRRSNQATVELSRSGELCLRAKIAGSSRITVVVDAVGYVDGNVDRDPPPVTTPPTTPPTVPSGGKFTTLPVGASLPSGAACADRVRSAAEIRPENATANANRGSRANANTRDDWAGFNRVDGDFAGTTDEIIQWAACKWGIDEDIVRAQVVKESFWYQSANGDGGQSWGLGQVRWGGHGHDSAFETDVNAINSSAYNLDYVYAVWRGCFEGEYGWLNTVERGATYGPGDAWGCTGVWFSGRWYTDAAIAYIEGGDTNGYGDIGVKQHYSDRTWETASFING